MERWKKSWEEKDRYFKYAGWLYQYSRPYLKRIAFIMAMNFAITLGSLVLAIISKNIIDSAGMKVGFAGLMGMYLLLAAGIQVFNSLSGLLSVVLTERFSFGMRKQLYEQIINSQWMDVKRFHSGDLMTRLTSDATNVSDGIISTLPGIMQLMVELVLVFFTLFYYSRLLAVLALLIAPAAALTTWWMGKKIKNIAGESSAGRIRLPFVSSGESGKSAGSKSICRRSSGSRAVDGSERKQVLLGI